jgi:Ser/Thr protein kinase RdoA (MazF antagonist)
MNSTGCTPQLLSSLGATLGSLTRSVATYDHPAFHRVHAWDLANFNQAVHFADYIEDEDIRAMVKTTHSHFVGSVLPMSQSLRKSVIMGDCNDANVIVDEDLTAVRGIIDFGDVVYTWTVNESKLPHIH